MPEPGGPSAQSGFLYQNLVAAEFLVKLLTGEGGIRSVQIEGRTPVGDLVIKRQDKPTYYVQVKERAPRGNWTSALLDRLRFWENVLRQIQYDCESQILFISESSAQALTELTFRARSIESTEEFLSNISETRYLLADLQKISNSTGATGQQVKDMLTKLTICGSYGSADVVRERIFGMFEPKSAEQFLSAILSIIAEGAKKRLIIDRSALMGMLASKGIPMVPVKRCLLLESLDDLIERGQQNILRLLRTKLRVKYDARLFVPRGIQRELQSRLAWTSTDTLRTLRDIRQKLQETIKELSWDNYKIYKDIDSKLAEGQKALENNSEVDWFGMVTEIAHETETIGFPPDCDVINKLKAAAYKLDAIVAKAGTGKTNIAASFASMASKDHLVSFFTVDDLYLCREDELSERITEGFGLPPDLDFYDFLQQINPRLKLEKRKLLIVIDAINESPNYALLKHNIERLATKTSTYEVAICITCRDIFWSSFFYDPSDMFANILRKVHIMERFSHLEFVDALKKYIRFFRLHIRSMSHEAVYALRHPLLLRFFCETYGSSTTKFANLEYVGDIRLKELFDKYWDKKGEMIRLKINHRNRVQIDRFLLNMAKNMLGSQKRWLALDTIDDSPISQDYETPDSPYVAILDEDVIIEKAADQNQIVLTFVYEEFMEYMMARAEYDRVGHLTGEDTLASLKSMLTVASTFPNVYGMLRYLAILLKERNGLSLWSDLVKADPKWAVDAFRSQQQIKAELWDASMADTVSMVARLQLNLEEQVVREYEWFDICVTRLRRFKKQLCETLMYLTFAGIRNRQQFNKKAAKQLIGLAKRRNKEAIAQLITICNAIYSVINTGETQLGVSFSADTNRKLRSLLGRYGYLNATPEQLEDLFEDIRGARLEGLLEVDIFGVSH